MKKGKTSNKRFLDAALAAYRSKPDEFTANLPEIARWFDESYPPYDQQPYKPKSPFGLTEHERQIRVLSLERTLRELTEADISVEQATQALEDVATLIIDDSLPDDIDHEALVKLLKARIGVPLHTITAENEFGIPGMEKEPVSRTCSVVRGVELALTWDNRLIRVRVHPTKIRERSKALSFVGVLSSEIFAEKT
jgi:hypothetical protein